MKNAKGMSQAMWVIISLVVALVVALILIMVVSSSSTKAGKNAGSSMDASKTGIDAATCQTLCNNCKMIFGDVCNTKWIDAAGPYYPKCNSILASCT